MQEANEYIGSPLKRLNRAETTYQPPVIEKRTTRRMRQQMEQEKPEKTEGIDDETQLKEQ